LTEVLYISSQEKISKDFLKIIISILVYKMNFYLSQLRPPEDILLIQGYSITVCRAQLLYLIYGTIESRSTSYS